MMRKQLLLSVIALSMVTSSTQTGICSDLSSWVKNIFPSISMPEYTNKNLALYTAAVLYSIGYIRLISKRTDKSGTVYNWKDLLKVWNIRQDHYWKTFDAIVVGEQFKLVEISKTEKDAEGNTIKIKDKAIKTTPKGFVGLTDAYILIQLKGIFEHLKNVVTLYTGSTEFLKDGISSK